MYIHVHTYFFWGGGVCVFPEIVRSSAEQRRINPTTSTRYLITLSREDAIPLPFTPLSRYGVEKRCVQTSFGLNGRGITPYGPPLGGPSSPFRGIQAYDCYENGKLLCTRLCLFYDSCLFLFCSPSPFVAISGGYGLPASSLSSR